MWTTLIAAVSGEEQELRRLFSQLEAEGIQIIRLDAEPASLALQDFSNKASLLLTDRKELTEAAKQVRMAAVFYEHGGMPQTGGVPYILQGLDGADRAYFQMVYSRYHGEPLVIAKTDRLIVRELACGEAERFFALCSEAGLGYKECPADPEEFVVAYRKYQYGIYEYGFWSLIERESGEWAGIAGVEGREDAQGKYLELGYAIIPAKRRLGYAREACLSIFKYLREYFEEEDICKIKCFVPRENTASRRTAQSIGMLQSKEVFNKFYCYERVL